MALSNLGGSYFHEFDPSVHICEPFVIPSDWRIYNTMDYGLDKFAHYKIAVDNENNAYAFHEIYESNLIISDAAAKIRAADTQEDEDGDVIKIGEDGINGSNQLVVNKTDDTTIDTGLDMYIFALNYDGQASNMAEARIYWLQIYQDGQLVRDYKPCLKNGVAALYDEVSKKIFYPEGEALAYEYDNSVAADEDSVAFVEYIESDGNSYLDTQVAAESPLRATGAFSYVHARTHTEEQMYLSGFWHRTYLGCKQDDSLNQMLMINESNQYFLFGYGQDSKGLYNSSDSSKFRSLAGVRFDFDVSFANGEQMLKISNGSDTWTATETWNGDVDADGNLYLFAYNHVSKRKAVNQSAARCYGLTLYKNEEIVRNFRPCVKDGQAALYDTVSKRIFYPTPSIPAEGHTGAVLDESFDAPLETLLEYVETDGTQYVDTEVVGKSGTMVEFKETRISSDSNEKCFIGSRGRSNSSNVRYFPWYHAGGWDIGIGYGDTFRRVHKDNPSVMVEGPRLWRWRCAASVRRIAARDRHPSYPEGRRSPTAPSPAAVPAFSARLPAPWESRYCPARCADPAD